MVGGINYGILLRKYGMEDDELRDGESVCVWKEKISEVNSREWREEVEEKSSLK